MSSKSKLAYLKILLNYKQGVYDYDQVALKSDLITLKRLLLVDKNSQDLVMQNCYNVMVKKLQKIA